MADYLLIHGAWHGAWCWYRVISLLEEAGHTVRAIDLPGRSDDTTPLADITFDDFVNTACRGLEVNNEPTVLVGHSLGGITISAAAERAPDRIARLVYLSALLPQSGQSAFDIVALPEMHFADEGLNHIGRVPAEDGLSSSFRPDKMREVFYADCRDEDIDFARANTCAEPTVIGTTPVNLTAERFGRVPRDYIQCRADRSIPLTAQRAMVEAVGCDRVYTLDTSHSPFLSAPEQVVNILTS